MRIWTAMTVRSYAGYRIRKCFAVVKKKIGEGCRYNIFGSFFLRKSARNGNCLVKWWGFAYMRTMA